MAMPFNSEPAASTESLSGSVSNVDSNINVEKFDSWHGPNRSMQWRCDRRALAVFGQLTNRELIRKFHGIFAFAYRWKALH